ncbi:CRISPR-associated endonuclease Cas1 [Sedimentisphaera salicampi]|uniref:CRISPR-associated endonuclease Cas1 n=2 Tax=Sedimentisphaera salicampi TaxID=1941349 RepID=A0A1W6LLN6_9BACT|nr:CRISPR-associated endonuclease Cas1 [Sedimentisphaera salicampi]
MLNTLFVTTQGAYLSKKGDTVLVNIDREVKLRVPIHTLSQITCFGQISMSPFLMGLCGEKGVSVSFLTENGRFLARVNGPVSGNVLLRKAQFEFQQKNGKTSKLAGKFVTAKIANYRAVLQRALRDNPENKSDELNKASKYMKSSAFVALESESLDIIRGIEGEAARTYFSVFDHLILCQKEDFKFTSRSKRPPLDKINAMLSFAYTLLVNDVRSALESVGLDPAVGFLHSLRPGRPSLALDIMEELRPIFGDRLILSLINRKQITSSGFKKTESGAVEMNEETRKLLINAYQKRKQDEIIHPFTKEKIKFGLLPHLQAMLLARFLRAEMEDYPPYFWK